MEENTNHESQDQITNDYFSHYELNSNSGNDDSITVDTDKKEEKLEVETKTESKVEDKSVKETKKEVIKDIPNDFTGRFYKKNDDGSVIYDKDSALKFLMPKESEPIYQYKSMRKYVDDGNMGNYKQDNRSEYEKKVEAEMQDRKGFENTLLLPIQAMVNSFGGVQNIPQEMLPHVQRAYQDVQNIIKAEFDKRDFQQKVDYEKSISETINAEKTKQEIMNKSTHNESMLISKMASQFGITDDNVARQEYSKLMHQVGAPFLNHLFDLTHPEINEKGMTKADFNKTFSDWYYKTIAGNSQNLNFLYKMAVNELNAQLLPKNIEQAIHDNKNYQKQINKGKPPSPSNVTSNVSSGNKGNDVSSYFGMDQI